MVWVEIGTERGRVVLRITNADGNGAEMAMEPDECREFINNLGGALKSIPRAVVTI